MPPRWSWLHWWEANRDRYLIAPSQDEAVQATDRAQLAALREEAARELVKAIASPGRDVVAAEAALALGRMRHEPSLPPRWPSQPRLAIGAVSKPGSGSHAAFPR